MADGKGGSRADGAAGCGCLLAVALGILAAVIQADIVQFIVLGASIGAIIGLIADPDAADSGRKAKPKRKARDGVLMDRDTAPAVKSIQRRRDVSRLEVPGGYVPFEMTRTETKTKDTVKRETTIKTYIDSREVKAVLKGEDVKFLRDGE